MATERFLEEFQPIGTAEWAAAIAQDLKGADYEKKLIWRSEEGMTVNPFYRAEDLKNLESYDVLSGELSHRLGSQRTDGCGIREAIDAADVEAANREAHAAVAAGAEEIAFCSARVTSTADLKLLTANLGDIPLHFGNADQHLIKLLDDWVRERHHGAVSTGCDALASVDFAAKIIAAPPDGFVPFTIHGEAFEESGATAVEEVGFALAAGVDFLAAMREREIDVDRAASALEISFAIGANYFFQIAKLRAFRTMWARAVEIFDRVSNGSRIQIAARNSRCNKTIYDPHVNILRATTEAMAAILGGADSLTVAPFDECYRQPDEASKRLARNTQTLLKHESSLGRVADAAGGSYYVEAITDFLAREGWKRFQEIEALGGYRKAQDTIAKTMASSLAAREKALASRKSVLVGTNQFVNRAERALERVNEKRVNETRRAATMYEDLRLRTERQAAAARKMPQILLAEIGDAKMRAARASFAATFFACAGFEIQIERFTKADEIASVYSDLIVLCSADAEYAGLAAELMPRLKALGRTTPVIVAGYPVNAEQLKAAGIADFVHLRSNVVEVLAKWQERLGIRD
jgi:methylmalonyl-CoA mutase